MAVEDLRGAKNAGAPHYQVWSAIDYKPVVDCMMPGALFGHIRPGMTVLEIGCGEGAVCRELARRGLPVTGIDINAAAIRAATSRATAEFGAVRMQFKHADILDLDIESEFDVVVMIRFLTCFPVEQEWADALAAARRALKPQGLIYVLDFGYTADRSVYAERYRRGVMSGYRQGAFDVTMPDGTLLFVAYHHDDEAIDIIRAPYEEVAFARHAGRSMNGNQVEMFEYLGRRKPTRHPNGW